MASYVLLKQIKYKGKIVKVGTIVKPEEFSDVWNNLIKMGAIAHAEPTIVPVPVEAEGGVAPQEMPEVATPLEVKKPGLFSRFKKEEQ